MSRFARSTVGARLLPIPTGTPSAAAAGKMTGKKTTALANGTGLVAIPAEPGEYDFACQMGMLRGKVIAT